MTATQLFSSTEAAEIIFMQRATQCQLQTCAKKGKQPFHLLAERDMIDFLILSGPEKATLLLS